jgi:hypothetical protein
VPIIHNFIKKVEKYAVIEQYTSKRRSQQPKIRNPMRIFMLLITVASLCGAMQPARVHQVCNLEGHSLVLSVDKQSPKHTVTSITYKEYTLCRHEEKINGRKKISYIGSMELELGYDESLTQKNARKVFISLMAKVRKLSANP